MLPQQSGPPFRRTLLFVVAPAFYAATAFAAGILLSKLIYRSPAALFLAIVLAFVAILCCPRARPALQLAAVLLAWIALGFFGAESQPHHTLSATTRAAAFDYSDHTFRLHLTGPRDERDAETWGGKQLRMLSVTGNINQLDSSNAAAGLQLTLESTHEEPFPTLHCGDTLEATAKLRLPETFHTPGAWSPADSLALQNIDLVATVHPDGVHIISPGKPSLVCRIATLRINLLNRLEQTATLTQNRKPLFALTTNDLAVTAAALLGDRSLLTPETRTSFQQTGTYHLLIVSGLSIAVLAAALYWLFRKFRAPAWLATVLTLTILTAYSILTGFGAPVRRALLMTAVYMVGRLLYRRLEALNSLGLAVLVLLAANPAALFDPGFQMTVVAVFTIAGIIAPLFARRITPAIAATQTLWTKPNDPGLPPRAAQLRVTLRMWTEALQPITGRWLARGIPRSLTLVALRLLEMYAVSLALELCLAPLMAAYFHRFTTLSVLANGVTLLWLALLLPLAFITLLLSLISTHAAAIAAFPLALLLHTAQSSIAALAHFHLSQIRIPPARPLAVLCAAALFFLAITTARSPRKFAVLATCLAIAVIGALSWWSIPLHAEPSALEITTLDVGQGDAILVIAPGPSGSRTLLIDSGGPAGPSLNTHAGEAIGENVVSNYLWSRGIRHLDAIALTHAHSDHMGGMPTVIRNFAPSELWVGANPNTDAYTALLAAARETNTNIQTFRAGDQPTLGNATITVESPTRDYQPGDAPSNEDSLVLAITYANHTALLEGDAQKLSEVAMLSAGIPHANLLKVGHHGSLSSTTPAFLTAVAPQHAVISSGRYNLYKHPRMPILQRLEDAHVQTWRTDTEGTTTFLLDSQGVHPKRP